MQIAMVTCLIEAFMANSFASFLVSQKTIVLPWLPLYTWTTSPITAARWDQWHVMARCYRGKDRMRQQVNKREQNPAIRSFLFSECNIFVFLTLTSTVVAAFCVFLPIKSICLQPGLMYFLATSYTQGGQVAENRRVCGLVSLSAGGTHTHKWASIILKMLLLIFRSTIT